MARLEHIDGNAGSGQWCEKSTAQLALRSGGGRTGVTAPSYDQIAECECREDNHCRSSAASRAAAPSPNQLSLHAPFLPVRQRSHQRGRTLHVTEVALDDRDWS